MNETDIAWTAGFFEGEGTLHLNLTYSGFQGWVAVTQKDRAPLEKLQELWGGAIRRNPGAKTWYWLLSGKKALPFLAAILSYIVTPHRGLEIEMYMKFYSGLSRDARMEILMWWVTRVYHHKKACEGLTASV